jgi:acetolactate synthase-1/3 small subunit
MSTAIDRTFIVHVEDRPGVLNRVISLVRRRGFNIDSLNVGRTERTGVSRLTLSVKADDDAGRRLEANLYKLVNVLYVKDVTRASVVARELALIKVGAAPERRSELLQLSEVFRARAVNVTPTSVTLEITGAQDKIDGLLEVLRPFGILEMVRTGAVVMTRSAEADPIIADAEWENHADRPAQRPREPEDELAA